MAQELPSSYFHDNDKGVCNVLRRLIDDVVGYHLFGPILSSSFSMTSVPLPRFWHLETFCRCVPSTEGLTCIMDMTNLVQMSERHSSIISDSPRRGVATTVLLRSVNKRKDPYSTSDLVNQHFYRLIQDSFLLISSCLSCLLVQLYNSGDA